MPISLFGTRVAINATTAGSPVTLLASGSGISYRIHAVQLTASVAGTIEFKNGSTSLTNAMTIAVGIPYVLPFDSEPWWLVTAGNAFTLTVTGASNQISGSFIYTQW